MSASKMFPVIHAQLIADYFFFQFIGSMEESLLQRRFEPKYLVPGYKVLLGASGCYCTNQITIPAYTFFYELNGETLSTPYVVS